MLDIREQIINTISQELEVSKASVVPDAHIMEDLGADSLDLVELVISLEDHHGIRIEDEDVEQMNTVQQILDYVTEKLDGNQ